MDDTAVYECSVSNDAGEDQRAVELTVQGRGDIAITCVRHPEFLRGTEMRFLYHSFMLLISISLWYSQES